MLTGRRGTCRMATVLAVAGLALFGAACGNDRSEPSASDSSRHAADGDRRTPADPDAETPSNSDDSGASDTSDGSDTSGTKDRSRAGAGSGAGSSDDTDSTSTPVPDDPNADPEDGVVIRPRAGASCAEVATKPAGELDGQCTMAGGKKGSAYSVDCTDGRRLWFVGDGSKSYFGFERKRYQEWDNDANYAGYERAMNACES